MMIMMTTTTTTSAHVLLPLVGGEMVAGQETYGYAAAVAIGEAAATGGRGQLGLTVALRERRRHGDGGRRARRKPTIVSWAALLASKKSTTS